MIRNLNGRLADREVDTANLPSGVTVGLGAGWL